MKRVTLKTLERCAIMTEKMYLLIGRVTCPDVAEIYGVPIGSPEYQVSDAIEGRGYSADFGTVEDARRWCTENGIQLVEDIATP